MVEPIMYFGLGFLIAALLTIGIIPLVHNRAVRLTVRRLEEAIPVSMAEIQADKDQLRAEFAMSTRRLEMTVEQMKTKTTSQLTEIAKKSEAISKLKTELSEKSAALMAIESRERALREQMRATEQEFAVKTNTLHDAERTLADKKSELDKLSSELMDQSLIADSQRVEVVALRAQVEALKGRVDQYDREVREVEDRLSRERVQATEASKMLGDEHGKVEHLSMRASELEAQLASQQGEAEASSHRVTELESRLAEQGRLLADRDYEQEQLRNEIAMLRQVEGDLRSALEDVDGRHRSMTHDIRAEKAALEERLGQTNDDRGKLQRELAAIKRDAESSWASERVENALLRERINDIAAEVARMTAVLEGPESEVASILAAAPATVPANGLLDETFVNGEGPRGTLADRIRALQSRASQVSQATN